MMKRIIFITLLNLLLFQLGNTQPPVDKTANENEYDQDKIADRSKKSHKKEDKNIAKNKKAEDKANKKAEKERKEKLGGKKKKEEQHKFDF